MNTISLHIKIKAINDFDTYVISRERELGCNPIS